MLQLTLVLSWITSLVFLAVVVIVSVVTYRRVPLRSLPWIAIYLVVSSVLNMVNPWLARQSIDKLQNRENVVPDVVFGELVGAWTYGNVVLSNVVLFILAMLIFADIMFLLTKAGIEPNWKPAYWLLGMRRHSMAWGVTIICLLLVAPLTAVALRGM